ncbi:ParB family protein [Sodalis sp. RH22]|uniref:ParB family protein n=1 Tax=unclassified Sodalis (in: enterobacteria) TaxID=2636512 RepID=UPI0039B5C937
MAELTSQGMADKLLSAGFERSGPSAAALSDPIADTPMVVTLDELRPYELDPRRTRNPLYEEIKASVRERGLDAPPPITRRPGAEHFIIRNGGNTRLAILRELWAETKEERFFRISCLFRPWPERGEIIVLTGHLAEDELHGRLSFIERALGVEEAREFYEQEDGRSLSQSELARRLSADGYPIQQSHISRMQDAVRYLLPVIPTVLYGGLGRHQVERLGVLRRACERAWEAHSAAKRLPMDFASFFQDVLAPFDAGSDTFSLQRVQDELIGQMAELLELNYDTLNLEVIESEHRQQVLTSPPAPNTPPAAEPRTKPSLPATRSPAPSEAPAATPRLRPGSASTTAPETTFMPPAGEKEPSTPGPDIQSSEETLPAGYAQQEEQEERLLGHIISPAPTTDRLQSIQRLVADQLGDQVTDFADNVLQAIPIQVGGLYPITDVWYIEPGLETPERLRVHIAQFAREIAGEASATDWITLCDDGIGFVCTSPSPPRDAASFPAFPQAVLTLLAALANPSALPERLDHPVPPDALAALLYGHGDTIARLSDEALVKLFRLLRLARRLLDLEAGSAHDDG